MLRLYLASFPATPKMCKNFVRSKSRLVSFVDCSLINELQVRYVVYADNCFN